MIKVVQNLVINNNYKNKTTLGIYHVPDIEVHARNVKKQKRMIDFKCHGKFLKEAQLSVEGDE